MQTMILNEEAINKTLANYRFFQLIERDESINDKHWGLDNKTLAMIQYTQEIKKRNKLLFEKYLPKKKEQSKEFMKGVDKNIRLSINDFRQSLYFADPSASAEKLDEALNKINTNSNATIAEKLQKEADQLFKEQSDFRNLCDSNVSLMDKLLNNHFAQACDYFVVPGTLEKRCVILMQGGFQDYVMKKMGILPFLAEKGFGGTILINTWFGLGEFASYLIKGRYISAYLQDTGMHHSSTVSEQLVSSICINQEDRDFIFSIPHNHEGDEVKHCWKDNKFLNEMKPSTILF